MTIIIFWNIYLLWVPRTVSRWVLHLLGVCVNSHEKQMCSTLSWWLGEQSGSHLQTLNSDCANDRTPLHVCWAVPLSVRWAVLLSTSLYPTSAFTPLDPTVAEWVTVATTGSGGRAAEWQGGSALPPPGTGVGLQGGRAYQRCHQR